LISAINLRQIEVKFSNEVEETSATTPGNYTIDGVAVDGNDIVTLLEDGKTVLITKEVADVFTQQDVLTVTVSNVQDADGNVVEDFTTDIVALDNVLPTALNAKITGPTTLSVEFSEPVTAASVAAATYSLDNNTYSVSGPALSASNPRVVTLNIPANLPVGAHTIKVSGLKDHAGFTVNDTTLNFTKVDDTTAPTATVKSASPTQVVLKFSEPVNDADADINTDVDYYHTYNGQASYRADSVSVSADRTEVTLNFTTTPLPTGNVNVYLDYVNNANTKITDDYGNVVPEQTFVASVTTDTTAPTVTKVQVVNNTTIDVTFSEAVTGVSAADFSLRNAAGDAVAVSGAVNTTGNTYRLTTAQLTGGTYTLSIAAGAITDTAPITPNPIAAYSTTVNVADTIAPTVTGTGSYSTDNKKIFISFSEAMATTGAGSVLNPANYRYAAAGGGNQSALPNGTVITQDSPKSVVITLPAANGGLGGGNFARLMVGQVADLAGNATTALQTEVTLSAADLGAANIENVRATSTGAITFVVKRALSAIDANDFTIDGAAATSATYVNNGDGTATVTVTAANNTGWTTDLTGLDATALSIAAGGLTDANGVSNGNTINIANTGVADYVAPAALTSANVATVDADNDGKIDAVDVTFSENIYVASVQESDFQVDGYTITGVSVTGAVVTIALEEKSDADSGVTPAVTLTGSVSDNTAQRNVRGAQAAVTATDAAAPVILSITENGTATVLTVTFSEAVSEAAVETVANWTLTSGGGETISTVVWDNSAKTATVTLSGPAANTDSLQAGAAIVDAANNAVNTNKDLGTRGNEAVGAGVYTIN